MDIKSASEYWLAIDKLEAQETLLGMQVASYPHLKSQAAKRMYDKIYKQAKFDESQPMSNDEFAAKFLSRINNV